MREINRIFGRSRQLHIFLIIVLFVILTGGFNFVNWSFGVKSGIRIMSVLILLFTVVKVRLTNNQNFRYYVLVLAILPFASVYYSHNEYGQPIFDGLKGTLPSLMWLFYFLLHYYKVKEGSILKAIFYISVFIALVQIIQQFTYPHAYFGINNEDSLDANEELVSTRNGLWRFMIGNNGYFTAITLFVIWCRLRSKMTWKLPFPIILMLVSIYLTLTRQIIFSVIATLFLSYFIGKGKMKIWPMLVGTVIVVSLYVYSDELFGDFIKLTQSESNKNYIRFVSANYFWKETFSSVAAMFVGHGVAVSGEFLSLHEELKEQYRFFVSDVGFIGMMWRYGIFYVYLCYELLVHVFWERRHAIPVYIRLFVMYVTIISVMIYPMHRPLQYIVWCLLLYICDIHINRSKVIKVWKE